MNTDDRGVLQAALHWRRTPLFGFRWPVQVYYSIAGHCTMAPTQQDMPSSILFYIFINKLHKTPCQLETLGSKTRLALEPEAHP